jgi:hypothetical protein
MIAKVIFGLTLSGMIFLSPIQIVYHDIMSFYPHHNSSLHIKYEGNMV